MLRSKAVDLTRFAFFMLVVLAAVVGQTGSLRAQDQPQGSRNLAFSARIAGDELRTRIVVDFESAPDFTVHYLDDPERIIIDLPETDFAFDQGALEARGLFSAIRYGAMGPGRSRMVLTAIGPVKLEEAKVEIQEDGRGHRLVLDAMAISDSEFQTSVADQSWGGGDAPRGDRVVVDERAGSTKPFTVVLDPGHGGIDAGAKGRAGTDEKDVTLAFARAVAEELGKGDDIRVVLTRDDDRFVSLSERVRIARQHDGDLMMSIHADSIRLPDIRGATVYTLSDKASDALAADLARRENEVDELAGISSNTDDREVADILLDLTRRETKVFSVGLARAVLDRFQGEIRLINNSHRFAGFSVLRAPDVPSVLVELGYLSNAEDEKLLINEEWRQNTAGLLADAIRSFRRYHFASAKDL